MFVLLDENTVNLSTPIFSMLPFFSLMLFSFFILLFILLSALTSTEEGVNYCLQFSPRLPKVVSLITHHSSVTEARIKSLLKTIFIHLYEGNMFFL